jgi:zinc transporter ZupT
MAVAWALAVLGLAGVAGGLWLGQSRTFSNLAGAAAGGLLFGIAVFWLVPEIASNLGWITASAMTIAVATVLAVLDYLFLHARRHSSRASLAPVLSASALHSFIDGWSVRALGNLPIAGIAAPLGLALHKIPEGIAIGWIAKQTVESRGKAAAAAAAVELLTVIGALIEPWAHRSGVAAFGVLWTSEVIAAVAGSFLFFGLHALAPTRRRLDAIGVFAVTFAVVGAASLARPAGF